MQIHNNPIRINTSIFATFTSSILVPMLPTSAPVYGVTKNIKK